MAHQSAHPAASPLERLRRLGVRPEDVSETFTRSGGSGGQNVNKVATCVVLVHKPTGLGVRCSEERSQYRNRAKAWEILVRKLEKRQEDRLLRARHEQEKLRRRNRPLSRAAKQRRVEEKRLRSKKKEGRGKPRHWDG